MGTTTTTETTTDAEEGLVRVPPRPTGTGAETKTDEADLRTQTAATVPTTTGQPLEAAAPQEAPTDDLEGRTDPQGEGAEAS